MAANPAWRYLPAVETAQTEAAALIERANACGSALRILNDDFGLGIPEIGDTKSWKIRCPYSNEHADGGIDKNTRFYWDADRAYCFADHGILDYVALRSMQWSMGSIATAKAILRRHEAEVARKPWWERVEDIRQRVGTDTTPPMRTQYAQAALTASLRDLEGYSEAQYRPAVREAVQTVLEALDPSWDFEHTLLWVEAGTKHVQEQMEKSA